MDEQRRTVKRINVKFYFPKKIWKNLIKSLKLTTKSSSSVKIARNFQCQKTLSYEHRGTKMVKMIFLSTLLPQSFRGFPVKRLLI